MPRLQEKLIAENKAGEMEAELAQLREKVATAEQTASMDQKMYIRAYEERMAVLDKVCVCIDDDGGYGISHVLPWAFKARAGVDVWWLTLVHGCDGPLPLPPFFLRPKSVLCY